MVNKTVLDNGIRVISEEIDHVRSVSIGAWVGGGSRCEDRRTNGTTHFIEHMLFKGTERRSAFDIASSIDSVGGVMNAATGKEFTSLYIKIPDYHLDMAVDLLADIFTGSLFDEEEINRERSVITQEIRMVEDTPDDYIHDLFDGLFWKEDPLGFPILGTGESIGSFRRDDLFDFFLGHYGGDNLILTAAGNVSHGRFEKRVQESFGSLAGKPPCRSSAPPIARPGRAVFRRELEQAHLIVGSPAPSMVSPERQAAFLLNAVLGGSMSSRLFQEIREKRGLAYDVGSYLTPYRDTGMFGVYAGTDGARVQEVLGLIREGLERSCAELLTEKELRSAKEQLKGNLLLGMESTDIRMTGMARNEMYFGRHVPSEEIIERIDAVGPEEIRDLAAWMFRPEAFTVVALGQLSEEDVVF
jgi:predicted Zn-dependent peptidase